MELVLCSASPRRREFLARLGVRFSVAAAHIDETRRPGESAREYVMRMAREKASICVHSCCNCAPRSHRGMRQPRRISAKRR